MKILILLVSVAVMGGVALMARSERQPGKGPDYQVVANWPQLPADFKFGQVTGVAIDSADQVYVFHRGKQPIAVFSGDGKFLRSWGDELIKTAHGLRIDGGDNVWVTDIGTHLVMKFDAKGKLLLTLGQKNKPGDTPDKFNKPA